MQLVLSILKHIEVVVSAALFKKLEVVALLDYLAVGKHDNVIGVLNGGKPVGYHKHRAYIHHFLKRILDKKLGFGIDICRCLIEDHNRGLMNYCSRKGKKLALTCGEVVSALTHLFVEAVFKLVYKVIRVYVLTSLDKLLVCNALVAKDDIGANSSREEEHVLKHLTEMAAKR